MFKLTRHNLLHGGENPETRVDIDVGFIIAFSITFLLLLFSSYKSYKAQTALDLYSTLTIFFLVLTIALRITGLSIDILLEEKDLINETKVHQFLFFELPFATIMLAALVQLI